MNFEDITQETWTDFVRMFPQAFHWLLGECLKHEKIRLEEEFKKGFLTPERELWIRERLETLSFLF
jgi:hypothetical protein